MRRVSHHCLLGWIGLTFALFMISCSEITLPRLEWEGQAKDPTVPLRVKLELDSSVKQGAFSYTDACGNEKVFQYGPQLSQMLLEDSQKVFQQVVVPQDPAFASPADGVLQYTVLEKHYDLNIPRLESDAEYPAHATLRLRVVLRQESTGEEIYTETFQGKGRWNVSTDEDGVNCEPIGIGVPIDSAFEALSDDLVKTMRDSGRIQANVSKLVDQRGQTPNAVLQPNYPLPPISTPKSGSNAIPQISPSPGPVKPASQPTVQFRTKLIDANRNLVLEGGEAVKLLLEVQNVSPSAIPSAYVEIRGTPVLVEAFERVVSIPVPLGSLKAGEKRTAEIRARIPRVKRKMSGELIVGIILSEGIPPGSHSILTEITPSRIPKQKTR